MGMDAERRREGGAGCPGREGEEEEEEEEGRKVYSGADAVNEEDPERYCAPQE